MSRREEIIQAATKLFAQKGYYATSMQEIAEQSGMAKGSIYNYFKSKEEIAVCIFRYHYEKLFRKMAEVNEDETLSPREKFEKQLSIQIEEFYRHKELVQMHMGEQAVKVNDEVHHLVFLIRAKTLNWYRQAIQDIYGERVKNFALDCATILNGMLKEYMFYMAIDQKELQVTKVAPFLLRRLDAIVESMTERESPLLTIEIMQDYLGVEKTNEQTKRQRIIDCIDEILETLEERDRNESDIIRSLEMLKQEFSQKEEARKFIVEALLLYLESLQVPLLRELKAAIQHYFRT
ncbi:TetR/AcrR family transcriptional regulator [Thermaerobacillus caldiproteolyticus]|uniref:TetR/AcrR family transcriptional regulator n=1 Tax=Thermaerobacillus caldiproteolyticus TaxID=247480 RepID=UPI00188DA35B|nr:TetR/AcrR family transcriptional regulator [Anoxybacillus caldiproteolyticus]QPA30189.1 TetR/AcrR family transcriptional regulator [Anoxybacillus caldiproteolyticus]